MGLHKKFNILIGEHTAERIKIEVGGAIDRPEPLSVEIKGRSVVDGLPHAIEVTSTEIVEALREVVTSIIEAILKVLGLTPPELGADIADKGIILTGGGSLLYGLDQLIYEKTGVKAMLADNPKECVVVGTGLFISYRNKKGKRNALW